MMRTLVFFSILPLFLLLFLLGVPEHSRHKRLVLVGGGSCPVAAKRQFIDLAGGKNAHLLIVPSASENAESPAYIQFWGKEDVASVGILHAKSRQEAESYVFYSKIRDATGVWISGGDQGRLADLYGDTPVVDELKMLLARGGVVGGTSAGASIAGEVMPHEDKEMVGFGLIDKFIIDQHFTNRHRENRLRKIVDRHPGMLGVGIDEGTAVIVNDGEVTVIGDGGVKLMGF